MAASVISLRFPARCASCQRDLSPGAEARWDKEAKQATCANCLNGDPIPEIPDQPDPSSKARLAAKEIIERLDEDGSGEEIDRGVAGGSAAREWKRRHQRREQRVRERYGIGAGLVLAVTNDPHSTNAWAYGANGEKKLGDGLDPLREQGIAVLHDRIPGTRANIDHLIVAPSGVFVVDAKNYKGRVERRDRGGFFSTDYGLYIGGRDKTDLVNGVLEQVKAVREVMGEEWGKEKAPIFAALCFVDADWSLFARPFDLYGVQVLWPRALGKLLRQKGALGRGEISRLERHLALALPAA